MHVFAYGSLMDPDSLRAALPDVAFPNDDTQPDKRYEHPDGYAVNGVCIPIDDGDLGLLEVRERRYDPMVITASVLPYSHRPAIDGRVVTFVRKPMFTPARVPGRASRTYLDPITAGAKHWDALAPELDPLTMTYTLFPPAEYITELRRIDL